MTKIKLFKIGKDDFLRKVYITKKGLMFKESNSGGIYTTNKFYGEPIEPINLSKYLILK